MKRDRPAGLGLSGLDVVPPELPVPPGVPLRGDSRRDAAIVVDRQLVALAGLDGRCRLLLARLARRLIETRAWKPIGFVRLSDYARESLGLSPRTLELDAMVMRSLDSLPRLRAAIESGLLSWTRLRIVVGIATPQNEWKLLQAAVSRTTRQLEDFVRSRGRDGVPVEDPCPTSTPGASMHHGEQPSNPWPDEDADPYVRWNVMVSRRGWRMWRTACEMASRSAGSPLSVGQVLERVCAEASAGRPPDTTDPGSRGMPSAEAFARPFRGQLRADEARGRRAIQDFLAKTGVAEGFEWLDPARPEAHPADFLDAVLAGLDETDAFELDRRFQQVRLAMQGVDAQMAALLRTGIDRRLFRELGFATVKLYVEARLGCSARKVWSLVAIERESWRSCSRLREAWRQGRISHLAARALLPVIGELHGEAWVRRAGEVTLRRLHDEIAWALDRAQARSTFEHPMPPPQDFDVRADILGDVTLDEVQTRSHGAGADPAWKPVGAVRLDFRVPLSVAVLAETTIWQLRRGSEPRWSTFERVVALALEEWMSAPRHRDPVFERDGWRCSVPGCSSRRNLHDHHLLFRSHGGGNGRDNRTTVCAAHHLYGLHGGTVRARGSAPSDITWELGCRRGAAPWARLLGDRYL